MIGRLATRRRTAGRGIAARLGLLAIVVQAILFGWHHHDPIVAGRLPNPVVANSAAAPQALDDADGCEICQVLHHQAAAAADPPAAPAPHAVVSALPARDAGAVARSCALAFHARGPPPA